MKRKFRLSSFIFVTVLILIFVLNLFLFWKDLNKSTVRSDMEKIGHIEYKYKVAQRKFSDRVAWERVQQDSPMYNGDTIRTAQGAMAKLILEDTVIEIQEQTTIQIFYTPEGGLNLSVGNGNISVDTTDSKTNVSLGLSNGQKLTMEPGSKVTASVIALSDEEYNYRSPVYGSSSVALQSGNAVIETSGKETVVLNSGDSVNLSEDGTVLKVPVTVTSITDNLQLLTFDDSPKQVLLQWKKNESDESGGNSSVVVETSRNKNFTVIETRTELSEDSLNINASEGKTYWRIYLKDNPSNQVKGKIQVSKAGAIVPLTPKADYAFETASGKTNVNFSWKGNEFASYYKVEVSRTPDFSSTVYSADSDSTYALCKNLEQGTYYWKVTPFYSINAVGFAQGSEPAMFTVQKNAVTKAPELNLPAENSKITVKDAGADLLFMWKTFTESQDYTLQVSSDRTFSNILYSASSSNGKINCHFDKNTLAPGTYFWKVTAVSERNDSGHLLESKTRSFTAQNYVPGENRLIYPPDNFTVQAKNVSELEFMWKVAEEFTDSSVESVLQVASDSAFSNIIVNKTLRNSYDSGNTLSTGKYWWRVGIKSASNGISYTKAFVLNVTEPLKAPDILQPAAASVVTLQNENSFDAAWSSVAGAGSYIVKLFDDENVYGKFTLTETKTKFRVPESAFESSSSVNLKFSVQAEKPQSEHSDLITGPASEITFTVRKPQKVLLSTPADGSKIGELTAGRNPVKFTWNNEDGAQMEFILKKRSPKGQMVTFKSVKTTKSSVNVSDLTAGNYEWTVKATKDGIVLDAEKSFKMTVTPAPKLSGTSIVSPKMNQVIGPAYLKANKSIFFKWTAVSGATDYQFILYQKNSSGNLNKIYSVYTKSTSLTYKDLAKLDIGNFEWQVIAYAYFKDGRVGQESGKVTGRFSISFEEPEETETIDPGFMLSDEDEAESE